MIPSLLDVNLNKRTSSGSGHSGRVVLRPSTTIGSQVRATSPKEAEGARHRD